MTSWIDIDPDSDFSLANIPFGVFKTEGYAPRVGCAIGDRVVDLKALHVLGYLENLPFELADLECASLNRIIARYVGA